MPGQRLQVGRGAARLPLADWDSQPRVRHNKVMSGIAAFMSRSSGGPYCEAGCCIWASSATVLPLSSGPATMIVFLSASVVIRHKIIVRHQPSLGRRRIFDFRLSPRMQAGRMRPPAVCASPPPNGEDPRLGRSYFEVTSSTFTGSCFDSRFGQEWEFELAPLEDQHFCFGLALEKFLDEEPATQKAPNQQRPKS